jgi:hypothetical protein
MTGRELFDPLWPGPSSGSTLPRTGVPSDRQQKALIYNILLTGGQTICDEKMDLRPLGSYRIQDGRKVKWFQWNTNDSMKSCD